MHDSNFWLHKSQINFNNQQYNAALDSLVKAVTLNSNNVIAHLSLGAVHYKI